ncbi:hypothetical protein LXL04_016444 [Taraxacum kok-saghyz]
MLKRIDDEQVGRKMTCFAVSKATGAKVQIFKSATVLLQCRYRVVFSVESPVLQCRLLRCKSAVGGAAIVGGATIVDSNMPNLQRNRIKPTSNSPNPEAQTHTRIPTRRPDPSLQYPRSTHTKCLSKCLTEFPRTPSRVPEHIPITPGSRSKDLGHHRSFSATTKPLPRSIDTTPIIISVTNLHPQPQPSSTISASAPIPISNHLQPQRFPPHLHRYGSHHQPHDSIPFTISAIEATIRTARSSQFIYHPQFDQPQRSTFPNSNPQPQQAKAHNLLDEMPDRAYLGNDQDTIEPCPDKPSRDRYSARAYQLFDEMPEPTPRLRSGFLGHLLGHHQPLLEQPEQVWSMISELGFSKTIFQSHITKIEKSLEADLKKYHDTMVNSDICKSELQTLQLKFGELTRTKTILERDVERKSEDYNHVLKQLNNALIQKRDLELKNQSIISSETKDVLELEILQLKQNLQESTENSKTLNEKLIDSLKQINFLETKNKKLIWNMDSIKVARKLSDDVFTKANSLGTGKIDTNYRPGIGRESFENELANSSTNSASSSTNQIKHINKTANTPLTKPKVFEKQPKKPVQPYLIHQKQISKQKPKPFQKPFENHFQDITFNHLRNFQKPSNQKVLNHNHQKDFQNHYPHPRYEEHFSNISSNLGYPSPNHRSYESTGFQKQITFWLNMINQIKPLHPQKPNSYNKVKNRIKPTSNSPNPEAQTHTRIPTRRPDPSLQYPRSTHTKCLSKCLTEFPRTPSRVPEHIPITPGSRSKDLGHHRSFSATTKPLPRSIDTTPIIISVTNLHPQPQPSSTISASAPIPISNHLQPQRFPPHLHRYGSHHQPHDSIPFTISAIEATIRTARSSQFIYHPQFDQPQRSTFPNSNPQPQQAKAHNLLDEMPDRAYLGNDQDTIEPCPDKPSRDRYSARAYQLFDEMPEPTPRLRSGFLGHLLGHHQPLLEQPGDPATYPFTLTARPDDPDPTRKRSARWYCSNLKLNCFLFVNSNRRALNLIRWFLKKPKPIF